GRVDAQGLRVDVAMLPGAHTGAVPPAHGDDAEVVHAAAGEDDLVAPPRGPSRADGHYRAMAPGHDGAAGGERPQELDQRNGCARGDGDRDHRALALEDALARH